MADKDDERERKMNPTNLAGARRLMNDPKLMDEAMESGLGGSQRPDPTYDDTSRRRRK